MSESTEFGRGVAAGEISQRLREHDQHLNKINGSMNDVARRLEHVDERLGEMKMQLQRMADAMTADKTTVAVTADAVERERISTATAVEKERTTLRDSAEKRWSPLARLSVIIGIAAALAGIIAIILANLPRK